MDPVKEKFYPDIVDGVLHVHVAGNIIEAYFPRVSVIYGFKHCIALAFNDIANIPPIRMSDSLLMDVRLLVPLF